ncbi:MAG: hypothetical protein J5537_08895, partial [Lachnospiraceae bacterium]|nr:hypothetical protein [Lachnospiraceae bacterium]
MKTNISAIKRVKSQDKKFEMVTRRVMKSIHNQHPKQEIGGLMDNEHVIVTDKKYEESITEFWIEDGLQDWTDEEIRDYMKDMECHNNTPYDCSGKMVTYWIT